MTAPLAGYAYKEGSGSTTADNSGNGHTATLNNATFTTGHGDGDGAITNTAATQGATSTVPAITTTVTLMAWIKPLQLTAGTSYLACGILQSFNGNTDIGLWTQRGDFSTSNVLQANVRISGGLVAANHTAMTVGSWEHVAVTYDGTNIRLYRGGTLVATVANSGTISFGTTFYVAGGGAATEVSVTGVRLYNTALSQQTIAALMNLPVGGAVPIYPLSSYGSFH